MSGCEALKPSRSIPSAAVVPVLVYRGCTHGGHTARRAYGARILMEPTDYEYGERQSHAEDLAGHQWTFSETLADVAPEEWGGESVSSGLRA